MIDLSIDEDTKIAIFKPQAAISVEDIKEAAKKVDSFIEAHGDLAGLLIVAENFPGWDSFTAMLSHLKFVKDHHRHIKKVAYVTNSRLLEFAPAIASHFVSAKLKSFDLPDEDKAVDWILSS